MRQIFVCLFFLVSGCTVSSRVSDSTTVQDVATPATLPVSAITDFTDSLQCMDTFLSRYQIPKNIKIVLVEDRDTTGQVVGAKDMMLTALSKMSMKSSAIRVVAISADNVEGLIRDIAFNIVPERYQDISVPIYYLKISQPQLDNAISADRLQAGLRIRNLVDGSLSKDTLMSAMSIDFNMGNMLTLENIPGVYSSNTVAIRRDGKSVSTTGTLRKLGALFRITTDRSEGYHHTLRQLVELGAVELVGRLTHIPYWECLDIAAANTAVQKQLRDWYESLTAEDLGYFIQSKLLALGYYTGELDGSASSATRVAIANYKARTGMLATGDMDFALYRALITDSTPIIASHLSLLRRKALTQADDGANTMQVTQHTQTGYDTVKPLSLALTLDNQPRVREGDLIGFTARATVSSYLYCYYQKSGAAAYKIFPNRFSGGSRLPAERDRRIPGERDQFNLGADNSGDQHKVLCLASHDQIENEELSGLPDLTPLDTPGDLDTIYARYVSSAKSLGLSVPVRADLSIAVQ